MDFFLRYFVSFGESWQRYNVFFVLFYSAALILTYAEYSTLPDPVVKDYEIYVTVVLLLVLSFFVRYRYPHGIDVSKNKFNALVGLSWVSAIFYSIFLELHFTIRYLSHPSFSLFYTLSLVAFLAPFISPFFTRTKRKG